MCDFACAQMWIGTFFHSFLFLLGIVIVKDPMCQIWSKLVQRFGRLWGPHIHIHLHIYIHTYKQMHAQTLFSYNKDVCVCIYSLWFCRLYRLWLVPWLAQQSCCACTHLLLQVLCWTLWCRLCRILLAQFSVYKRSDPVFFVCSESVPCSTELLCAISNPIIILTILLGNLFAIIANLDQDSITSMDSCKIGEALTDKCHQSYSKYKTRYGRINDMANKDRELLSLQSEVELDDAVDSVCDHLFNMYGSCYASQQKKHKKKCTSKYAKDNHTVVSH